MPINPDCPTCRGEGWVGEDHQDRPWSECPDEAGAPCPVCQPEAADRSLLRVIAEAACGVAPSDRGMALAALHVLRRMAPIPELADDLQRADDVLSQAYRDTTAHR